MVEVRTKIGKTNTTATADCCYVNNSNNCNYYYSSSLWKWIINHRWFKIKTLSSSFSSAKNKADPISQAALYQCMKMPLLYLYGSEHKVINVTQRKIDLKFFKFQYSTYQQLFAFPHVWCAVSMLAQCIWWTSRCIQPFTLKSHTQMHTYSDTHTILAVQVVISVEVLI